LALSPKRSSLEFNFAIVFRVVLYCFFASFSSPGDEFYGFNNISLYFPAKQSKTMTGFIPSFCEWQ